MNLLESQESADYPNGIVQSFLDISRLYLNAAEDIVALNFTLVRNVVANTAAVFDAWSSTPPAGDLKQLESNLAMIRAVASNRSLTKIAAEVQDDLSDLNLTLAAFPLPTWRGTERRMRSAAGTAPGRNASPEISPIQEGLVEPARFVA